MKRIPKKVISILDKRADAAKMFIKADNELVDWMNENQVDITHYELRDHILTGCESIINPEGSKETILDFLKRW